MRFYYVYYLRSRRNQDRYYVGVTADLKKRLEEHNSGKSRHTSKYLPWDLVSYFAFDSGSKAKSFEKYLKTSSGRAFAKKRF